MRRRHLFVPALVAALALFTVAAGAAWLASGTGSSFSRSTSLDKPTSVAAAATGTTSIQVTWQPPAVAPTPDSYDVFRYSGAPTGTKICSAVPAASPRVCNDSGLSPSTTYGYTVESRLGTYWMSGQTTQVDATTNAIPSPPNFLVELVTAGNKTAGTAFDVRVTARTGTTTETTYAGNKTLTFSGPGQNAGFAAPTYPASGTFTAGVATVSVTLRKAETATLTLAEGARSGSTSVTVVASDTAHVRYSSSRVGPNSNNTSPAPCSPGGTLVVGNGTFFSKVTRLDASGNTVTGAAALINLAKSPNSGTGPPSTVAIAENQPESSEFSFSLANGPTPPPVTLTASIGSASVSCTIRRNP